MRAMLLWTLIPFFSPALSATPWTIDEVRARFIVRGEVFVMDPSGRRIIRKVSEWRTWRDQFKQGKIDTHWSGQSELGFVGFHHHWEVQPDGSIKATIEQYGREVRRNDDEGPELKDLIKKKELVLENLEPISWVVSQTQDSRTIMRFTPDFSDEAAPESLSKLPISGTDLTLTDNQGNVWATHVSNEARYCGFITHRGAVFISYYPFPGATELGQASGHDIELKLSERQHLTLTSSEPFLPPGVRAKVYGIYQPNRRTGKLSSTHLIGSSAESEFLEKVNRK